MPERAHAPHYVLATTHQLIVHWSGCGCGCGGSGGSGCGGSGGEGSGGLYF